MKIEKLKTNHVANPLGFAMTKPVFSYVVAQSTGKRQAAARIRVAADTAMTHIIHDSGRREDISSLAYAPEIALTPRTRYYWDVEVWAEDGDHGVSAPAWFETGKMGEAWQGKWIRAPFEGHPVLFQNIPVEGELAAARLYLCGLGL